MSVDGCLFNLPVKPAFSFPDVVDEITVRLVAAQVLALTALAALTQWWWLYALLALDFALRIAFGPRSPLAQVALRALRPRLRAARRPTPGPPKRFAAGIGLACSLLVLAFAAADWTAAIWTVASLMVVFPLLEAGLGFCAGCLVFSLLIRAGLLPERICVECADITRRLAAARTRLGVPDGEIELPGGETAGARIAPLISPLSPISTGLVADET